MTRQKKIEALAEWYANLFVAIPRPKGNLDQWQVDRADDFKAGILAGIKLRDEELLAMEFDEKTVSRAAVKNSGRILSHTNIAFSDGARWQHEQFMKSIKGE